MYFKVFFEVVILSKVVARKKLLMHFFKHKMVLQGKYFSLKLKVFLVHIL